MPYAERTEVPVERTKAEIERLVTRYGARRYQTGWDDERGLALVMFDMEGRRVRFVLGLPEPSAYATTRAYEQERRRRWRALLLVIKAKLESVASGIEQFEESFLAQIVLPGNTTVYEQARPAIQQAYLTGQLTPLLALPSGEALA